MINKVKIEEAISMTLAYDVTVIVRVVSMDR
jgi:hypothetical protein